MDFSILLVAPIAAFIAAVTLAAVIIARKYREPRSLLMALLAAFAVNAVLFEPWHYLGWHLTGYGLLTLLGFCLGSLLVLVPAKTIMALLGRPL